MKVKFKMKMTSRVLLFGFPAIAGLLFLSACQKSEKGTFLGSAVIEVDTYQVPSLVQGPLVSVLKQEGDSVSEGELLALVDTVPYALQYQQAAAGLAGLDASYGSQSSQISSLQAQTKGLEQEFNRVAPLSESGAATAQQLDKVTSSKDASRFQLEAARRSIQNLGAQKQALYYQLQFLQNQLLRCRVVSPGAGVVLTKYRNTGEAVTPGQSIYEVGRRDSVHLDFFVPQGALASLRLRDSVRIRLEGETPEQTQHVPALIRFISSEAEFTPKNIQTRESRSELVFRVRAEASSEGGLLKRGLPVEVWQ